MDVNGFNHTIAISWEMKIAKPGQRAEYQEWLMHISQQPVHLATGEAWAKHNKVRNLEQIRAVMKLNVY